MSRLPLSYRNEYGEAVDAVTLIPHMLEAFIAGDRGFKKGATPTAALPK